MATVINNKIIYCNLVIIIDIACFNYNMETPFLLDKVIEKCKYELCHYIMTPPSELTQLKNIFTFGMW